MQIQPIQPSKKVLLFSVLALSVSHQALGVGFMINPTSHLTGIANAGSAVYDGSTAAISNNPAAMSLMSQKQIWGNFSVFDSGATLYVLGVSFGYKF